MRSCTFAIVAGLPLVDLLHVLPDVLEPTEVAAREQLVRWPCPTAEVRNQSIRRDESIVCTYQLLFKGDVISALNEFENAIFATARAPDAGGSLPREELYENFARLAHQVGASNLESVEVNDELIRSLWWRRSDHPNSTARAKFLPVRTSFQPAHGDANAIRCAVRVRPGGPARASTVREDGCVTHLTDVCVEGEKVLLFGEPREMQGRTCGEFGSYFFSNFEWRPAREALEQVWSNRLLMVLTGMMTGVSESNPFHILHVVAPATWQLQHPDYGLCAPRTSVAESGRQAERSC